MGISDDREKSERRSIGIVERRGEESEKVA